MGDGVQVFIAADDGTLSGTKEEREVKLAERRLFEIDQYYHIIEPFTFKTVFIDISGTLHTLPIISSLPFSSSKTYQFTHYCSRTRTSLAGFQ
jgi:hypothetical protein